MTCKAVIGGTQNLGHVVTVRSGVAAGRAKEHRAPSRLALLIEPSLALRLDIFATVQRIYPRRGSGGMAKARKSKTVEDSKQENSGAVVRHQKLCLSIDSDTRRIYGLAYVSSSISLLFLFRYSSLNTPLLTHCAIISNSSI